jgi:hypothetical protein
MSGCTPPSQVEATADIIEPTPEGAEVLPEEETAVFDIHSWPPGVMVRFHLKGLEEMTLAYGDTAVTLNISSLGGNEVRQSVDQNGQTEIIHSDSPYWLNVTLTNSDGSPGTIPLEEGSIDVILPTHFHETNPESFSLNWIDFFR